MSNEQDTHRQLNSDETSMKTLSTPLFITFRLISRVSCITATDPISDHQSFAEELGIGLGFWKRRRS
jgi:hypothetical protein